jgi:hypothetical protein
MLRPVSQAVALGALAFLGCQDDPTGSERPPLCTAIASVGVSSGLTPTFSWTPDCGANFLVVLVSGEPGIQWGIQSFAGDVLSPVTYGQAPLRTTVTDGPIPLEVGGSYEVLIGNVSGPLAIPLATVSFQR